MKLCLLSASFFRQTTSVQRQFHLLATGLRSLFQSVKRTLFSVLIIPSSYTNRLEAKLHAHSRTLSLLSCRVILNSSIRLFPLTFPSTGHPSMGPTPLQTFGMKLLPDWQLVNFFRLLVRKRPRQPASKTSMVCLQHLQLNQRSQYYLHVSTFEILID